MGPQALILRDTQSIWVESLRRILYAASCLTQISSLPSRAVKSFQDGSSAFHVEATVLQVDPQKKTLKERQQKLSLKGVAR